MNRVYLIAPLLGVSAFATYYHRWNREVEIIQCTKPLIASYDLYERRNGAREAREDLAQGKVRVLTYGLPVAWTEEYRELLAHAYAIELRTVAGCMVTDALLKYADNYNAVSRKHITEQFGEDIFARTLKEAEALYARRHLTARSPN